MNGNNNRADKTAARTETATALAESFTSKFGYGPWGRAAMELMCANETGGNEQKAAEMATVKYGPAGRLLAYALLGMRSSLPDWETLRPITGGARPAPDAEAVSLLGECVRTNPFDADETHHLVRMLYSCLRDADSLASETGRDAVLRSRRPAVGTLRNMLNTVLKCDRKFVAEKLGPNGDRLAAILSAPPVDGCPQFVSVTPPHGCDSVFAAVAWALNNAERLHKDRVIVAVPVTNVLVSTAQTLKSVLGEDAVLEHRGDLDYESVPSERAEILGTRNWDSPVVVTSCAKLFGTMYAAEAHQCRKLHNLCGSIVIVNEVQSLPVRQLAPVMAAMRCYAARFGTTFVLAGSFLPALSDEIRNSGGKETVKGLGPVPEIVPEDMRREELGKRVALKENGGGHTAEEIAETMLSHKRILCVVSTRRSAKRIYEALGDAKDIYHISGTMCASHIAEVIDRIRTAVSAGRPARVVSTQVLEIRQDIGFPVVLRERSGLDSMVKAARLCRGENGRKGELRVFSLEDSDPRGELLQAVNACESTLLATPDFPGRQPFEPESMDVYFRKFYHGAATFDADGMEDLLADGRLHFRFETAAAGFSLIRSNLLYVLVNWGDGCRMMEEAKNTSPDRRTRMRMLKYSVGLHPDKFNSLCSNNKIVELADGSYCVPDGRLYDHNTGLSG